jgi:hypothetical protein
MTLCHRLRIRTEERSYNDNSTNYAGWVYTKYQLLPLLIQNYDFPLDVYLSGKAGRYLIDYTFDNENYRNWHYGAYAGASFYFFKNLGIYGEIGYGNESIFEAGLNWRF